VDLLGPPSHLKILRRTVSQSYVSSTFSCALLEGRCSRTAANKISSSASSRSSLSSSLWARDLLSLSSRAQASALSFAVSMSLSRPLARKRGIYKCVPGICRTRYRLIGQKTSLLFRSVQRFSKCCVRKKFFKKYLDGSKAFFISSKEHLRIKSSKLKTTFFNNHEH
jgi:hypothetical protein